MLIQKIKKLGGMQKEIKKFKRYGECGIGEMSKESVAHYVLL